MSLFRRQTHQIGQSDLAKLIHEVQVGRVTLDDECARLTLGKSDTQSYSDAQVDDYHEDRILHWRPPVQMRVRARFSRPQNALAGTAGFGFWNEPFGMTEIGPKRESVFRFRLPQALWFFFASPPSNMDLALDVPGYGWKAATIDASGIWVKLLLPFAPLGMLACRWHWAYRRLWPLAQRILKIDEAMVVTKMEEWHEYTLIWEKRRVRFSVDSEEICCTRFAPRGPLGFVAWVDNQYMVVTPQGLIRNGLLAMGEQWMEIADLEVRSL
jgi:hypothetical protein